MAKYKYDCNRTAHTICVEEVYDPTEWEDDGPHGEFHVLVALNASNKLCLPAKATKFMKIFTYGRDYHGEEDRRQQRRKCQDDAHAIQAGMNMFSPTNPVRMDTLIPASEIEGLPR